MKIEALQSEPKLKEAPARDSLVAAIERMREQFNPYKVAHTDHKTGKVFRFSDIKTLGKPFKIEEYLMPYNPSRMCAMTTGDALVDPNLTIKKAEAKSFQDLKVPRWNFSTKNLKTTEQLDLAANNYQDYSGKRILKVDRH